MNDNLENLNCNNILEQDIDCVMCYFNCTKQTAQLMYLEAERSCELEDFLSLIKNTIPEKNDKEEIY